MADDHRTLFVHSLLTGEKHSQSCGRKISEFAEIENEFGYSVERISQLGFELRRSIRVEPSG